MGLIEMLMSQLIEPVHELAHRFDISGKRGRNGSRFPEAKLVDQE